MITLTRTLVEGSMLCSARMVWGDEAVANVLFGMPNNHGFIMRHSNQLNSLMLSSVDSDADPKHQS